MAIRGVLVLAGEGPRARLARNEATCAGMSCTVLTHAEHLASPGLLAEMLEDHDALRIDSPDRDFASLAALCDAGEPEAAEAGYHTVRACAETLAIPGTIGSPAQVFYGLRASIEAAETAADGLGKPVSHRARDVACAHDKLATHDHLAAAAIPMPRALGPVAGFDALLALMAETGSSRVFLKLRHGSAAAGMIALARRTNGEMQATTTAILTSDGLRSTRRLQRLNRATDIAPLVDALTPLGLFAERWMARASVGEGPCDLRIVCVGNALFPVLRTSRHPMTNLHLGGTRLPANILRERMSAAAWEVMMADAHATARAFPGAMSVGLDMAVGAGCRDHAVLEVNAFGDFVHGLKREGRTPAAALLTTLMPATRSIRGAAA